jgi:hypothetical protein
MGYSSKSKEYSEEFQILKWADDNVSPLKIRLMLPTRFDPLNENALLEKVSNLFGIDGARWVADMSDEDVPGFDYNLGLATIAMTAPLPNRADWNERYLTHSAVHWGFFPMALGSENGLQLENEDGKIEHVLGYDPIGQASKFAEKQGVQVGPEIVAAPHALIAGGTGGGKALDLDTIIPLADGSIKLLKNIVIGDELVGTNGPTVVTQVFEDYIPERMYEISFENGLIIQASGCHLWSALMQVDKKETKKLKRQAKNFFKRNMLMEEEYNFVGEVSTIANNFIFKDFDFIQTICDIRGPDQEIFTDDWSTEGLYVYDFNKTIEFLRTLRDSGDISYSGKTRNTDQLYKAFCNKEIIQVPS